MTLADGDKWCCLLPFYCLWLLLQGLVLSAIGAIKGLILIVPVTVITLPSWTLATLVYWPKETALAFWAVTVTRRLGPNLRLLGLLLLPPTLLAWPLVTLVLGVLFSLGVGFFWPMGATVAVGSLTDLGKILRTGFKDPLILATDAAREVWRWNGLTLPFWTYELRAPYYGEPLDVSPLRLAWTVLLAAVCSVASTAMVAVLGLLRVPVIIVMSLFAWLVAYGRASLSAKCFWWPLWLLAGPCIPLVVLLGYVVAMLCGLAYVGPECGVLAYLCTPSHRGIAFAFRCALARMYFWVYKVDSMAEQFALGGRSWCTLPRPGRGPGDMHQWQSRHGSASLTETAPNTASSAEPALGAPLGGLPSPTESAWASLGDLVMAAGGRCLAWGWVPCSHIEEAEAYLFIGLPAAAVLQLLADAVGIDPRSWEPEVREGSRGGGEAAGVAAGSQEEGSGAGGSAASKEQGPRTNTSRQHSTSLLSGGTAASSSPPTPSVPGGGGGSAGGGGGGEGCSEVVLQVCSFAQLPPAAASSLLHALADHVLAGEIGYSGAANPVRLHKSLAELKVTPGELRYMMCHSALVGDDRVGRLAPLRMLGGEAAAEAAAAGTARDREPGSSGSGEVATAGAAAVEGKAQSAGGDDGGDVEAGGMAAAGAGAGVGAPAVAGARAEEVTLHRLSELHAFTAAVQSVATALSRKDRMKGVVMRRVLEQLGS